MADSAPSIPVLEESFRLEQELGRGGFGSVYLGVHLASGERAAVKLGIDHGDADQRQRILREVRLLRKLRHPRLANLLGLFETRDGQLALVYQLVEGTPLSRLLAGRSVPPRDVLSWLADLVEALGYLHGEGVLHRDLKSGNVMIEPAGRARLLDFGLARAVAPGGTITATGLLFGTPEFMAPELFRGDPASPATDRYALAAMVHEWVTGRPPAVQMGPFGARAIDEGAMARLPRALASALRRALAAAPEDRPQDLETLFVELESGLVSTPAPRNEVTRRVEAPPLPGGMAQPARRGPGPESTPRRAGVRSEISRKLRSRRLAFRRGAVGMCLMVAAVAAWALSRAPVRAPPVLPSEPPTPEDVLPAGPLGRDFRKGLEWELQELEGLYVTTDGRVVRPPAGLPPPEGARNLLTPDYRFFPLRRERLPSARRFADWLAAGGTLDELSPELVEDLREVDTRWAGEGLERPFHPFLYVQASESPVPLPPDVRALGDGGFPAEVSGWLGAAVEWSEEALRNLQEMEDQVDRCEGGEDLAVFADFTPALRLALRLHQGPSMRALAVIDSQPRYRVGLGEWIRSLVEPTECLLYAAERHLAEGGQNGLLEARVARLLVERVRDGIAGHLLEQDRLRILPGLPDSLPQWYFAAYVAEVRVAEQRSRLHRIEGMRDLYELAIREVFARSRVGDETWPLRAYTLRRHLVTLLEAEDFEEARTRLQERWDEIRAMSDEARALLLAEYYCREVPDEPPHFGLLPEQLPATEALLRAHWNAVLGARPGLGRGCLSALGRDPGDD